MTDEKMSFVIDDAVMGRIVIDLAGGRGFVEEMFGYIGKWVDAREDVMLL